MQGPEVCDGLDNDCNGVVDQDDPGGGGACDTGLAGDCAAGTMSCLEGRLVCVADLPPQADLCDGADNDCDGELAEDDVAVGVACVTGEEGVCGLGETVCHGDQVACGVLNEAGAEVCDGLDNDCDGVVDNAGVECRAPAEGSPYARRMTLTTALPGQAEGTAPQRRTGELVEIPLVAGGWADGSVVGHWPLDGAASALPPGGVPPVAFDGGAVGPAADRLGTDGRALEFAGGGSYGFSGFGGVPANWSLCVWAQPRERLGFGGGAVATLGSQPPAMLLELVQGEGGATPSIEVGQLGGGPFVLAAPNPVPFGAWVHLCVVRHVAAQTVLYIDGVAVAENRSVDNQRSNELLRIGGAPAADGRDDFRGVLDDLVLLRRPLSPMEVRHLARSRGDYGAFLPSEAWPYRLGGRDASAGRPDFQDVRVELDGAEVSFEITGARVGTPRDDDLDPPDEHVHWPLGGGEHPGLGRFGDWPGAWYVPGGGPQVLDDRGPDPGDVLTFEAFARREGDTAGARWVFARRGERGDRGYGLRAQNGVPECLVSPDGADDIVARGHRAMGDRLWHHLGCVWDGAHLTLYVDGQDDTRVEEVSVGQVWAAMPPEGLPGGVHAPDVDLVLGGAAEPDSDPWLGWIDELAVHTVARSADWMARRGHPLPRIRLRVDTADAPEQDSWAWPELTLRWGDPTAAPVSLPPDESVLSPATGTLAHWRFDGDPWRPVVDRSRRRLDGGAPAEAARHGSRPVTVDAGGAWLFGDEATVEVIARQVPDAAAPQLLLGQDGGGHDVRLVWQGAGEDEARFACQLPGGQALLAGGAALPDDTSVRLACTYSDGRQEMTVEHGGEERPSPEWVAGDADLTAPDTPLVIGADADGGGAFSGGISAVRISDQALSPAALLHVGDTDAASPDPAVLVLCTDADQDGFDRCDADHPDDWDGAPADCNDADPGCRAGAIVCPSTIPPAITMPIEPPEWAFTSIVFGRDFIGLAWNRAGHQIHYLDLDESLRGRGGPTQMENAAFGPASRPQLAYSEVNNRVGITYAQDGGVYFFTLNDNGSQATAGQNIGLGQEPRVAVAGAARAFAVTRYEPEVGSAFRRYDNAGDNLGDVNLAEPPATTGRPDVVGCEGALRFAWRSDDAGIVYGFAGALEHGVEAAVVHDGPMRRDNLAVACGPGVVGVLWNRQVDQDIFTHITEIDLQTGLAGATLDLPSLGPNKELVGVDGRWVALGTVEADAGHDLVLVAVPIGGGGAAVLTRTGTVVGRDSGVRDLATDGERIAWAWTEVGVPRVSFAVATPDCQ